jgi:hypothetical protein
MPGPTQLYTSAMMHLAGRVPTVQSCVENIRCAAQSWPATGSEPTYLRVQSQNQNSAAGAAQSQPRACPAKRCVRREMGLPKWRVLCAEQLGLVHARVVGAKGCKSHNSQSAPGTAFDHMRGSTCRGASGQRAWDQQVVGPKPKLPAKTKKRHHACLPFFRTCAGAPGR